MTAESWARVTKLFGEALDLLPDQRPMFLQKVQAEAPDVAGELISLIEEHERPGEFLREVTISAPLISDLSGTIVGPYRLVRLLGEGGMGAVYLAERSDGAFSKQVAVKVLSPAFFRAREWFERERNLLARLDHPNITRLLDGGSTASGLPYLVVEYVEGVPITRYSAERNLPLGDRLTLLGQLCAGIAHAHQRLIIHSDIKPDNILVTADGVVKILDFGIATLRDGGRAATLLQPATPVYSSPEQLRGQPLTTASDVFAIGVVAYEVLTGSIPYAVQSHDVGEILRSVLEVNSSPPSRVTGLAPRIARQLRGDLDAILGHAMAKDPARRYASVQQFADDIERHRAGFPIRARPRTIAYRAGKFVGRYRVASALAGFTIASLVLGITLSVWQTRVARRRFEDLRHFAHAVVFDVNDTLAAIPGTTRARKQVVETALEYLDRLGREDLSDPALREELAAAYIRIGKVQGGAFTANLGDSAGAVASFRKAVAALGPSEVTARLQQLAIEAHINIALLATDPVQSLPEFDAAIEAAERHLAGEPADAETLRLIADACHGRGTVDHVIDRVMDEASISSREIDFRRRVLAVAPDWRGEVALANAMAQHALAFEQAANYDEALAELRRAVALLDGALAQDPGNQVVARTLADMWSRSGSVLLAMGMNAESTAAIQRSIHILEPLVAADRGNAHYRGDLAYAWFRLAETLRADGDLGQALDLHERALAVRRERVARDPSFTFIRWELSRSLNAVGELMLAESPLNREKSAALFREARDLAESTLQQAPSFNELRRQMARAYEGLGRAALARGQVGTDDARRSLERSLHVWQEVLARGPEDRRDLGAPARLQTLLASLPRQ